MRIAGTGKPTLIFVHGFCCAGEDWDRQLNVLSANFRCIALDLPGHGHSAPADEGTVEAMAQAVDRAKAEEDGGTILIGHSLGCRIVTEAYRQSPAGIAALVYVDGSRITGDLESATKQMTDWIDRDGIDAMTAQAFDDMFIENSDPEIRRHIVTRALRIDPRLRRELAVNLIGWDIGQADAALAEVAVPVLALQSTYFEPDLKRRSLQPGMTTPWTDLVAARIPGAEIKIITGAGHFSMLDAAPAITAEIAGFAARFS